MDYKSILDQLDHKKNSKFKENCLIISEDIHAGKITIHELIEHLGSLLTNEDPSKRDLGTSILTEVLKDIQHEHFNAQQLAVLAEFYSRKLKDHHQIFPAALSGILTLIQFKHFPSDKIPVLLNSIFHNVPCQQQQREDRFTIFEIFERSLGLFKEELVAMKLEFVYGVMQCIEGERDPRNLLFLFKWMKLFLSQFSLQHLTEEMFDVLACYFPVEFRAPPNDNSITREGLAESLGPCLCAIPDFGDSCVSLALEKLDSSLEIAKIDSLKLLKEGSLIFEPSVYLDKASEIWSLLQKEILRTNSDEVRIECLTTLSTVVSKICEDENGSHIPILQNIVDTLKGNLLPDSKLFDRSSQILVYTGAGSEKSCKYINKEVVPILTNIFNMTPDISQRSIITKTLVEFVKIHLKYNKTLVVEEIPELSKLPLLCLQILKSDGIPRMIGYDCLAVLVPYLDVDVRQNLYIHLQASIFNSEELEIEKSFLRCLKTIAGHYPDEVKAHVFTKVMTPAHLMDPLLKSMVSLINLKEFRSYVIQNFMQAIIDHKFSKIAVHNTRYLVENERTNNGLLAEMVQNKVIDSLVQLSGDRSEIALLEDISAILKIVIAAQTSDVQRKLLEQYFESILVKIEKSESFLLYLDGFAAPLRRDITISNEILDLSANLAITSQNNKVRNVAIQLFANLVNKRPDDENLVEYLEKIKKICENSRIHSSKDTIVFISWTTKALLMRNHPHGLKWLDWLLQLLELHAEVPEGLKIIMNDNYESLSTSLHCHKSSLYRQKTFVYITNKICEVYDSSKMSYLRALGYVLEFTPIQAITLQFSKISRFIILSLEKNDEPDVLNVLLNVVKTICTNHSVLLETQLEDFLTRILKLTTFEASMKVRIESLKCLLVFTTTYPVFKLLPFKSTVLQQLQICVDDKKRLVRREAMEARSLWFLIGDPV